MTTKREGLTEALADLGLDLEFLDAVNEEARRNDAFFAAHCEELWERHQGKWMLIYGGSFVESFDDYMEMFKRLRELDPIAEAAARTEQEAETPWIL